MNKGKGRHSRSFNAIPHHQIDKLAFAVASRKEKDVLYASRTFVKLVKAFVESNFRHPSSPSELLQFGEHWDTFLDQSIFEPYREHCRRKHRESASQVSEFLHPKVLSFPLAATRRCTELLRHIDSILFESLICVRPLYGYAFDELRPLVLNADATSIDAYLDILASSFCRVISIEERGEKFAVQGEFVRAIKSPLKHLDELGAFYELDESGKAHTLSLLCLAEVLEKFQIIEEQINPLLTKEGELLPSGYDIQTLVVLWNKLASEQSNRFFVELPSHLLKYAKVQQPDTYRELILSFGRAVKQSHDDREGLRLGYGVPLEFPLFEREIQARAELERESKFEEDAQERLYQYTFELQQRSSDLERDIRRYEALKLRKIKEISSKPSVKSYLERERLRLSEKQKEAESELLRINKELSAAQIRCATGTAVTDSSLLEREKCPAICLALNIADSNLMSVWARLAKKEPRHILRDPISAGHFKTSLHHGRKAESLENSKNTMTYSELCRRIPNAMEVLDSIQIASTLRQNNWNIEACERFSRRELATVAIWEALKDNPTISLTKLKKKFPSDSLLVSLIFQRHKLDNQLTFYVASIKSCFVELFHTLKTSTEAKLLSVDEQELSVRTLFVSVWDWVCENAVNPYAERLSESPDDEVLRENARRYMPWLQRELSAAFEEVYPGLFAYLVLERPNSVYSDSDIRDWVWRDSASRSQYVRIVSGALLRAFPDEATGDIGKKILSFILSVRSPFSFLHDERVSDLDEFTDMLFGFSAFQSEMIDSRTRRYMVDAWASRNDEVWRGQGLFSGRLLSLILDEIKAHRPELHTAINLAIAEHAADALREVRDVRFGELPSTDGVERAELTEHIEKLTDGVDELDMIRSFLSATLADVDKNGAASVYGSVQ